MWLSLKYSDYGFVAIMSPVAVIAAACELSVCREYPISRHLTGGLIGVCICPHPNPLPEGEGTLEWSFDKLRTNGLLIYIPLTGGVNDMTS